MSTTLLPAAAESPLLSVAARSLPRPSAPRTPRALPRGRSLRRSGSLSPPTALLPPAPPRHLLRRGSNHRSRRSSPLSTPRRNSLAERGARPPAPVSSEQRAPPGGHRSRRSPSPPRSRSRLRRRLPRPPERGGLRSRRTTLRNHGGEDRPGHHGAWPPGSSLLPRVSRRGPRPYCSCGDWRWRTRQRLASRWWFHR